MRRAVALAAILTATAAVRAAAQDPRLERLDPATRAAAGAILDSARAARLPVEPLVDRALEGAAKGAAPDVVVAAVRRLAAHLGRARAILGPAASTPELEAGAAALRAGADSTVLATLRDKRRHQSLTVPLAVLTDLVASGVPPETAASAVLALAPTTDDELIEFRRSVERDIALGAPPAAAATVRLTSTAEAMSAGAGGSPPPRPRKP